MSISVGVSARMILASSNDWALSKNRNLFVSTIGLFLRSLPTASICSFVASGFIITMNSTPPRQRAVMSLTPLRMSKAAPDNVSDDGHGDERGDGEREVSS